MTGAGADLLIVGASTRAAAFSALRAGFTPLCLDLFADADLSQQATVLKIEDYPSGLIESLEALPKMPLVYVGGVENSPDVLKVSEELHELWGNTGSEVANVRDVDKLASAMRLAQVQIPEWRSSEDPPPTDGTWIVRPLAGSGGRGIEHWADSSKKSAVLQEPHLFQQLVQGESFSAAYATKPNDGDIRFIGVTRQLVGLEAANAHEFQWCGNVAPTTLSIPVEHKMRRVGNLLKWKFGLTGLFGVDFLVTDDEEVFITDVNPRYPASLELLEFATGQALFDSHARCYRPELDVDHTILKADDQFFGRVVLYSPQAFTLNTDLTTEKSDPMKFPSLADLPSQGEKFEAGDPICSIYATGTTTQDCENNLKSRLQAMRQQLFG